jgi:hypothetical protein
VRAQIDDTAQADPAVIDHLVRRWQDPNNTASLLSLRTETFAAPRAGRATGTPAVGAQRRHRGHRRSAHHDTRTRRQSITAVNAAPDYSPTSEAAVANAGHFNVLGE